MNIDLTEDQKDLQTELRQYFAELMTDDVKGRISSAEFEENHRVQGPHPPGRRRWLARGRLARGVRGQGLHPHRAVHLLQRIAGGRVPDPLPHDQHGGPDAAQLRHRRPEGLLPPKILAGDMHFSIGYCEPEAGTDLASLKTKAVKDGDEWVINGQKLYTSLAYNADYIWLAARTDPDARAHKGITMFLVPTDAEGFSIQPFDDLRTGRHHRHVLRRRAGARLGHRRRTARRVEPHHQSAQSRTGLAVRLGPAAAAGRAGGRMGVARPSWPMVAG